MSTIEKALDKLGQAMSAPAETVSAEVPVATIERSAPEPADQKTASQFIDIDLESLSKRNFVAKATERKLKIGRAHV